MLVPCRLVPFTTTSCQTKMYTNSRSFTADEHPCRLRSLESTIPGSVHKISLFDVQPVVWVPRSVLVTVVTLTWHCRYFTLATLTPYCEFVELSASDVHTSYLHPSRRCTTRIGYERRISSTSRQGLAWYTRYSRMRTRRTSVPTVVVSMVPSDALSHFAWCMRSTGFRSVGHKSH